VRNRLSKLLLPIVLTLLAGCSVGPDYIRPSVSVPPAFKEAKDWKEATPRDDRIPADWWKVFNDPVLNALEEKVMHANLSIAQAEAQYRQAQALVSAARANFFPRITAGAAATRSRPAAAGTAGQETTTQYTATLAASWEVDLWGRVRRQVESSTAGAEASAADLQAMRLSMQAELAQDYIQLRTLDTQSRIYRETVAAYRRALELTRNRYAAGVAAKADVVQAETQLKSTEAQAIDIGSQRAQLEHALAVLVGEAPSGFSLPETPAMPALPDVPAALPSILLERRPDVAAAERRVAAANAQIGVAEAGYFPTLSLSASTGYQSVALADLFRTPSFFWALGPAAVAQTIFDAGAVRAQTEQARAAYDATVAAYRLTVLTSFQQVEDALAALRILDEEARVQAEAVKSARESVVLTTNQYRAGIISYLNVIAAQTIAFTNERTALGIQGQQLAAAVLLIRSLGGGWDASRLEGGTPAGSGNRRSE
jgi:NodT family efflux transporter outer membrane factor (OMF) lipoprotein